HAGWRGAATGVLEATITAMERCGADRERVEVALGPTIRQPNYEVGPEFVARFKAEDGANERFFRASARPRHALFDLPGYITARLPRRRGRRRCEVARPLPLGGADAFFQPPPPPPPQRARLRAARQRHRARTVARSKLDVLPPPHAGGGWGGGERARFILFACPSFFLRAPSLSLPRKRAEGTMGHHPCSPQ